MGVRYETIHIVRPEELGAAAACGFRLVGRWSGYFAKHGEVRDYLASRARNGLRLLPADDPLGVRLCTACLDRYLPPEKSLT